MISDNPKVGEEAAVAESSRGVLRILCLEDNEGDFILLREYLSDAEFEEKLELVRAETLANAREILEVRDEEDGFDVVLLDLSLPDSQGGQSLELLRELIPHTPITILSGNADRDLAVRMVKEGAQDYLPKDSLNSELLTRSILYAVERQRSQTELAKLNRKLKQATEDLKTAQMQLIQAEKMDSLGRLAAGVAHEVKNPLATIQMGVNFFDRRSDELGEGGEVMVSHMQDAITRADRIICGMVDYSRSDHLNLEVREMNEIIEGALEMIQHQIVRGNVELQKELAPDLPNVRVDQGKMEQVLINLLMNAVQSMSGVSGQNGGSNESGGVLEVKTFLAEVDEIVRDEGIRHSERIRARDSVVVVEIRDHGPGIPEEKLTRIFEPFYTTKPTGEGTGLGLSVAKNIVDLHRGIMQVKNVTEGDGVVAQVLLKSVD